MLTTGVDIPDDSTGLEEPGFVPDIEIPARWAWASLGSVCELARGRFSVRPRNDPSCYAGQYPFVQIGDLPSDGGAVLAASQTLNEKRRSVSRSSPPGTILIATIGNTGVQTFETWCPDSLVGVQPRAVVSGSYIDYYLRWQKLRIRDASYASGGQPNINMKTLGPYPVPVPTREEQVEIVRQVEKLFVLADTIEHRVQDATARADKLPQTILSKAFSGELVPTEADLARAEGRTYETAAELLERVAAEKENAANAGCARKVVMGQRAASQAEDEGGMTPRARTIGIVAIGRTLLEPCIMTPEDVGRDVAGTLSDGGRIRECRALAAKRGW